MSRKVPITVSALVVIVLALYYFVYAARPVNLQFIDAVVAFSAVVIIAISYLIGSLARFMPKLAPFVHYRKEFGLIGYSVAVLHVILVVPLLISDTSAVTMGEVVSLAVAAVALMIFTLLALTSTNVWIKNLGYENWKNLQRTGYLALVFVLLHVIMLSNGAFLGRTVGQVVIGFGLVVLLLRAIAFISNKKAPVKVKI